MQAQGLLLPRYDPIRRPQTLYASLFSRVVLPKQRPRVFAMQLNIYVQMAVLVTEILVLDQSSMRKFASKLDDILKNCHLNFLLMIDFILSAITETQIKKSIDFKLLKTIIIKKVDQRNILRNRLTSFRQKNELSRAFLKRIACELTDLNVAKQAVAVQHLCTCILDTLKMTIEETGMDVTKNQVNQRRIRNQLGKLYEHAVDASHAMSIASKKAHMKKNQQHERKVKSVMRGQKTAPTQQQYQQNQATKYASPPPKRNRQQSASIPNVLEARLQSHLFGGKNNDNSAADASAQAQYLHTVEETDNTEASPSKSMLHLESQPTEQSPPKVFPEIPVTLSAKLEDSSIMESRKLFGRAQSPIQQFTIKDPSNTKTNSIKRKATGQEKQTTTATLKRSASQMQTKVNENLVKNVKQNAGSGQKKRAVVVFSQRQTSRSPSALQQRRTSPAASQMEQSKKLQHIVNEKHQQVQDSFSLQCQSLLPENIAFVMANSSKNQANSGADQSSQNQQQSSMISAANDSNFSLNLMTTMNDPKQQKMKQSQSHTLTKYKSTTTLQTLVKYLPTKAPRFPQREAPTILDQQSKTAKKTTVQKTRSQIEPFQLHTTRGRLNTFQGASPSQEMKRIHRQGDCNLLTTKPMSSMISYTDKNYVQQAKPMQQNFSVNNQSNTTVEEKKSRKENLTSQKETTRSEDKQQTEGPVETRLEQRRSELPARVTQRSLICLNADADANPFAVSFVEPDQPREISLFKSPVRSQSRVCNSAQQVEPDLIIHDEDEEVISSVNQTMTPQRDSLGPKSIDRHEKDESANFSLTPCKKDFDASSKNSSEDDDFDEDGSLIIGHSSETIPRSMTTNASNKRVSALAGATITSQDHFPATEATIKAMYQSLKAVVCDNFATSRSFSTSQKKDSPYERPTQPQHSDLNQSNKYSVIVPRLHNLELLSKSPPTYLQQTDERDDSLRDSSISVGQDIEPDNQHSDTAQQVGPFQHLEQKLADQNHSQFCANNTITPRIIVADGHTLASERPVAKVRSGDISLRSEKSNSPTKGSQQIIPKIQIEIQETDEVEEPKKSEPKIDDTLLLKDSLEEEQVCANIAGRRSSIRINSLLFEEDSMQIKQEMMRQKKEQKRIIVEQRISLKLNVGTARRLTSHNVMPIPCSARNTVSQYRQTNVFPMNDEVVFGSVSSQYLKKHHNQVRSHSLIDLDSTQELNQSAKYTEADRIDAISSINIATSILEPTPRGNSRTFLMQQAPEIDVKNLTVLEEINSREVSVMKQATNNATSKLASNSPMLTTNVQSIIATPKNIETAPESIITPNDRPQLKEMSHTPASLNQPTVKASEKGVKSAANAAYDAFYQSLLPKQNSQDTDNSEANPLKIKSRSMVTSFLEIPDTIPNNAEKESELNNADRHLKEEEHDKSNSNAYSNLGTFQTPERDPTSNQSPSNFFRGDTIPENPAEEDHSLESPVLNLPTKQSSFVVHRESFRTNAFESIDSFMQLENQLQNRGDSFIEESIANNNQSKNAKDISKSATICEELEGEDSGYDNQVLSTAEIDDEQEAIEAELAILRTQVKIPYLPPIDTTMISEVEVYTLVLDLDETLIHYECDDRDGDYYLIRPGALKFLKELALYYEIVIFTAAMPEYADKILDNLDENGFMIQHRLYRQHTTPTEDYAIKDLHLLGRELERTIIVDNLAENFQATTPNNGIWVESWFDDQSDQVLPRLQKFLAELVEEQVPDVRQFLTQEIKEEIIYACLESNKPIPSLAEISKLTKNVKLDR